MTDFMTVAEAKKLAKEKEKEFRWSQAVQNADQILDEFHRDLVTLMSQLEQQNDRNIEMYDKLKKITKSIREVKNESK